MYMRYVEMRGIENDVKNHEVDSPTSFAYGRFMLPKGDTEWVW